MSKGPIRRSGRPSKKPSGEAGRARAGTSGRRSTVVGGGRGALGPKAGDEASRGAGGKEAHCPLQEGLQVDVPVRFCAAREWRGFLADPAHSERGVVLDGAKGVRQRGGSGRGEARAFGGRQGRVAHRWGGRSPGRGTS